MALNKSYLLVSTALSISLSSSVGWCLSSNKENVAKFLECHFQCWVTKRLWGLSFVAVQSLSCVPLCDPMDCSMPGSFALHNLPEIAQIFVHWMVMLSNHLILCHTLLIFLSSFSSTKAYFNESALCIRWPKYWSFNFSTSPCKEYPVLISL